MSHNNLHSTAEQNVDRQTRACQALMAAVVTCAISDACRPPIKEAAKVHGKIKGNNAQYKPHTPTGHSRTAMYFLFDDNGGLDAYAQWLDMAVDTFRKALLASMYDDNKYKYFNTRVTEQQKRNFRFNYKWYLQKHGDINEAMYLCDDDNGSD